MTNPSTETVRYLADLITAHNYLACALSRSPLAIGDSLVFENSPIKQAFYETGWEIREQFDALGIETKPMPGSDYEEREVRNWTMAVGNLLGSEEGSANQMIDQWRYMPAFESGELTDIHTEEMRMEEWQRYAARHAG